MNNTTAAAASASDGSGSSHPSDEGDDGAQQAGTTTTAPAASSSHAADGSSSSFSCPICFRSRSDDDNLQFARLASGRNNHSSNSNGGCRHALCVDCWERLLWRRGGSSASSSASKAPLPTLGDCPVCRAAVSYFDLVYCGNSEDDNSDDNETYVHRDDRDVHSGRLVLPEALRGAVFCAQGDGVGQGSFHFPSSSGGAASAKDADADARGGDADGGATATAGPTTAATTTRTTATTATTHPYCDMTRSSPKRGNLILAHDQHYHAPTHTWQGVHRGGGGDNSDGNASGSSNNNNKSTVRVVLSFSADFRFVRRGILLQQTVETNGSNDATAATNFPPRHCLDGRWSVEWLFPGNHRNSGTTAASAPPQQQQQQQPDNSASPWRHTQAMAVTSSHVCLATTAPVAVAAEDGASSATSSSTPSMTAPQQLWYRIERDLGNHHHHHSNNDNNRLTMAVVHTTEAIRASRALAHEVFACQSWDWSAHPDGPVAVGSRLQWRRQHRRRRRAAAATKRPADTAPKASTSGEATQAPPKDASPSSRWKRLIPGRGGRRKSQTTKVAAAAASKSHRKSLKSGNSDNRQEEEEEETVEFYDAATTTTTTTEAAAAAAAAAFREDDDDGMILMEWRRVGPVPARPSSRWRLELGGPDGAIYQRWHGDSNNNVNPQWPRYNRDSIWGNTFCGVGGGRVGMASYHFAAQQQQDACTENDGDVDGDVVDESNTSGGKKEENGDGGVVYLSLEHSDTAMWPPLDNGAPLPVRIYFRNVKVTRTTATTTLHGQDDGADNNDDKTDEGEENNTARCSTTTSAATTTVFCGTLDFAGDCQTTWQGMERCEVELRFDPYFVCVTGGLVRPIFGDDEDDDSEDEDATSGARLNHGPNLQCCNAGLWGEFSRQCRGEAEWFPFLAEAAAAALEETDNDNDVDPNNNENNNAAATDDEEAQHDIMALLVLSSLQDYLSQQHGASEAVATEAWRLLEYALQSYLPFSKDSRE